VTICTDAFEQMAELEKRALGVPDLCVPIIEHPLVYRTDEEIEELADQVFAAISDRFEVTA
jgi:hypothetical protein